MTDTTETPAPAGEIHTTVITPAATVAFARGACAALSAGGIGMFLRRCGPAEDPTTAYISAGYISARFVPVMTDGALMHQALQAVGFDATLAQCEALAASADVSHEDPFVALERLGYVLGELEATSSP